MKKRYSILVGLFLLVVIMASCQSSSLKASHFQPRPDTVVEKGSTDAAGNSDTDCSALNPHPLAVSITEKFEITYDEVMILYCDGYAFSDILLALETSQLVDQNAGELLTLLETKSWEEIWSDSGISLQ